MAKPYRAIVLGTDYDDMISLVTPFETTIVINTTELATEMLDKQSKFTSDRPFNVMANTMYARLFASNKRFILTNPSMGWGRSLSFGPHDQRHKLLRRMLSSALNPVAANGYESLQSENVDVLLQQILSEPSQFMHAVNESTSSFIMRLAYGYVLEKNDPFVEVSREAIRYFSICTMSHFWVNWFPIIRYVPSWFPGTQFQRIGKEGKEIRERYSEDPFQPVLQAVSSGYVARSSFTSRALEEKGGAHVSPENVDLVKTAAASFFIAGVTTTSSFITTFILTMALHPEMVKKAQIEIESVAGNDQRPNLNHRKLLPFVDAFIQETMRSFPPLPLGLPHRASEGFEFRGHWIPKGAIISPNIWAMLHDSRVYSTPYSFDPTRFLKANPDLDPRKFVFGFGRRACPGVHIANNGTWLTCTGLLAALDVAPLPELLSRVDSLGGRHSPDLYKLFEPFGVRLVLRVAEFRKQLTEIILPHLSIGPLPFTCKIQARDPALFGTL
ncbi:cytochrome P450 [Ceratobasidium sp. AG-I]|nr:cytochrome P450 [Ceratobasidium sp. AG-I]